MVRRINLNQGKIATKLGQSIAPRGGRLRCPVEHGSPVVVVVVVRSNIEAAYRTDIAIVGFFLLKTNSFLDLSAFFRQKEERDDDSRTPLREDTRDVNGCIGED